jgi:hypothetical protein
MAVVSEIPQASSLQLQLEQILKAMDAIDAGGANIPLITIQPGPPVDPTAPNAFLMSIGLTLTPPIDDQPTMDEFRAALETQSQAVQQKLVDMGYTDDITMKYGHVAAEQPQTQPEPQPQEGANAGD